MSNAESVGESFQRLANAFSVASLGYLNPGVAAAQQPGLKLANAFRRKYSN